MTNEEIRRENARWLAKKCGGPTQFAEAIEVSESRVSQLIGKNPVKNIGNATARKIEQAFEKPTGWLDTPNAWHADEDRPAAMVKAEEVSRLVALFAGATDDGRVQILRAAELAEKRPKS